GPGLQFLTIHGGVWAAFKHADCSTFLRDPRLSAKRTGTLIDEFPTEKQKEFAELARTLSLWMLFFDAPEHTRLRKLMNKGFSPVAIESLRPQIEKIVHRLLMPLRNNHRMDILPQFAHPLPTYVIAELLSVPDSLQDRKSTRLYSSHQIISYAVFCLKKTIPPVTYGRRARCTTPHRFLRSFPTRRSSDLLQWQSNLSGRRSRKSSIGYSCRSAITTGWIFFRSSLTRFLHT